MLLCQSVEQQGEAGVLCDAAEQFRLLPVSDVLPLLDPLGEPPDVRAALDLVACPQVLEVE